MVLAVTCAVVALYGLQVSVTGKDYTQSSSVPAIAERFPQPYRNTPFFRSFAYRKRFRNSDITGRMGFVPGGLCTPPFQIFYGY